MLAVGCSDTPDHAHRPNDGAEARAPQAAATPSKFKQPAPVLADPNAECRQRIERELSAPSEPGAPALERVRAQVLGRAKATPVLFTREPSWESPASLEVENLRRSLTLDATARGLGRLYHNFYKRPELARSVLLKQGYLYTDQPQLAFALLEKVELNHLFDAEQVVIQRGAEILLAQRKQDEYVYATGSETGERAKVLLFDRVWAKDELPPPPLHVDLEALSADLGFWRARWEHATETKVVLNLRYGEHWVLTLLDREGAKLRLNCEWIEPAERAAVSLARKREQEQNAMLAQQRRVIQRMVNEALPFDEPRTEEGQQDGNLRPSWRGAYLRGEWTYEFNEDRYPVFDSRGRPRVPQVCIDFVTDTLERASGSWWGSQDEPRAKSRGRLLFDEFAIDNRRSVERFTNFAWNHPEHFDVYFLEPEERLALTAGDAFFSHLEEHAARYRAGDIVNILGLRSDEKYHYHSFLVYKSDPVTGMPLWLAGNAGRPRLRSWYGELLSAPRRSIKSRIRPRLEWLRSILEAEQSLAREPAPLDESTG
jgi:hypothetical protein